MITRKVTLVQRRIRESGGQLANIDPNLGHWAVDVVDDAGQITRFETFNSAGLLTLSIDYPPPGGDYKALRILAAPKGVTRMDNTTIHAIAKSIVVANDRYSLSVNNCQTFAMLLVNKILDRNSILGKFNAWQMGLLRNFA